MTHSDMRFQFACRSDVGLVRHANEDSAIANGLLLAVADGLGGHACGEIASTLAVKRVALIAHASHTADDVATHLRELPDQVCADISAHVQIDPDSYGMGTTLTCVSLAGSAFVVGHIGDSRAYLLRGGSLQRLTVDHTYVQQLLDAGDITEDQLSTHPQRSVILRALGANKGAEIDVSIRDAQVGDRVLVCSDGLSGEVPHSSIERVLATQTNPTAAVAELIQLALEAGAPDNVTCIVGDVIAGVETNHENPTFAGAAAEAGAAEDLAAVVATEPGEQKPKVPAASSLLKRYRTFLVFVSGVLATLAVVAMLVWSQWWVGVNGGDVVIGRGMNSSIMGVRVSAVVERTDMRESDLPAFQREQARRTIAADSLANARAIVHVLKCSADRTAPECASP